MTNNERFEQKTGKVNVQDPLQEIVGSQLKIKGEVSCPGFADRA